MNVKDDLRIRLDAAVINLWHACSDYARLHMHRMREDDIDVWVAVTKHQFVQKMLEDAER